jgi:hypothetical protein
LKEFSLEWFRYASKPLRWMMKGHVGELMIGSLRGLCVKISKHKTEVSLSDFLQHFAHEDIKFSVNAYDETRKRTLLHNAAYEGDIGVIHGLI